MGRSGREGDGCDREQQDHNDEPLRQSLFPHQVDQAEKSEYAGRFDHGKSRQG